MTTVQRVSDEKWQLTRTDTNFSVLLSSFGATIVELNVPDKAGVVKDVVLGFDTQAEYNRDRDLNPCFGSIIGRVANRIANSEFELDGAKYKLDVNCGDRHHLHGGLQGFHLKNWNAEEVQNGVKFTLTSEDGDQYYPG